MHTTAILSVHLSITHENRLKIIVQILSHFGNPNILVFHKWSFKFS